MRNPTLKMKPLKQASGLYGGVAVPLALVPGTGVKLGTAIAGVAVAGLCYGYFALMRHLF